MTSAEIDAKNEKESRSVWGPSVLFPGYYAFVPSEEIWHEELKRLEFDDEPYPTSDARCNVYHQAKQNGEKRIICLVTIHERFDGRHNMEPEGIAALLAHESQHVWRFIRQHAGETEPSSELEAYALQTIFQHIYGAYLNTRIRPRKAKRVKKAA